jgi:hypothetical protein
VSARRTRQLTTGQLVGAALVAWALPGCPLSDHYYLDAIAGHAGAAPATGGKGPMAGTAGTGLAAAGTGAAGGEPSAGGSTAAGTGGDGVTAGSGVGGSGGMGGTGGSGGSSGTGGTGGTSDAGGAPDAGMGGTPPDCASKPELCNGVDDNCDGAIEPKGVCPAGCNARTYGNHVYILCLATGTSDQTTYAEASARCESMGTELGLGFGLELAFVETAEEEAFLKDWVSSTAPAQGIVWMGANDIAVEGTWVWGQDPNATPFYLFTSGRIGGGMDVNGGYNDFGTGRPNPTTAPSEDCGTWDAAAMWRWNDVACTDQESGFMCEQAP